MSPTGHPEGESESAQREAHRINAPVSSGRPDGALLDVRGLCAHYGRAQVLFDVDLQVRPGEVVALMGRNGAGKSTTLKAIMGLVEQRAGRVQFDGHALMRLPTHRIAQLGMGYVPEDRRIFTDLTVRENLEVGRRPPRTDAPAWTLASVYALFPNLRAMADRRGSQMSGGEQQMLTVARTLMGNPRLVLLDEPSEGVAPIVVAHMARTIVAMKRQGMAVLVSEQNVAFAEAVADTAVLLEKGQRVAQGAVREVLARLTGTVSAARRSSEPAAP